MNELNPEKFFYTVNNAQNGPVSLVDLKDLASCGKLTRKDKIWKKGMPSWESASSITEIFEDLPPDLDAFGPDPVQSTPPPLPQESVETASSNVEASARNAWGKLHKSVPTLGSPVEVLAQKAWRKPKMVLSLIASLIILFPPIVPAYTPSGNPGLDAVVHMLADSFEKSDSNFTPYWKKPRFAFIFTIAENDRIEFRILFGEFAAVGLLWVGVPALKARSRRQKRSPES
jgi:hypothetical protein